MKKAKKHPRIDNESGIISAKATQIPGALAPWLFRIAALSTEPSETETEALLTLGKGAVNPLLVSLSAHCCDLYEIRNVMQELLDDDRYQEAHHILLLLYAVCREPTPGCVVLITYDQDLLIPYMWGVMRALEDYINEQNKLYKKEDIHAG